MQAALGVSQLKKLPKFIEIRKHNFNFLFKEFSKFDHFELPVWEKILIQVGLVFHFLLKKMLGLPGMNF